MGRLVSNSPPGPGARRSARLITRLVGKSLPRSGVEGSEPPWSPGSLCGSPASGHQWPLLLCSWGKAPAYCPAVTGGGPGPLCCVCVFFFSWGARITSPSLLGWKQRERTPGKLSDIGGTPFLILSPDLVSFSSTRRMCSGGQALRGSQLAISTQLFPTGHRILTLKLGSWALRGWWEVGVFPTLKRQTRLVLPTQAGRRHSSKKFISYCNLRGGWQGTGAFRSLDFRLWDILMTQWRDGPKEGCLRPLRE